MKLASCFNILTLILRNISPVRIQFILLLSSFITFILLSLPSLDNIFTCCSGFLSDPHIYRNYFSFRYICVAVARRFSSSMTINVFNLHMLTIVRACTWRSRPLLNVPTEWHGITCLACGTLIFHTFICWTAWWNKVY